MDTQHEETIIENPAAGVTQVRQSTQEIASPVEVAEASTAKKNQVIWYIVGIINSLLLLRIVFLLLGARDTGFATILYALTDPFVALFKGIFASPALSGAYFDSAAVLAIVIYSLIAWGLSSLLNVAKRPAPTER